VDPKTLIAVSPSLLDRGKDLFAKNCAQCHGDLGKGDGPAAISMSPRPRNFTRPDGWTHGHDLAAIYITVSGGVKGTSMAPFDYLSKTNRMSLAHYVQSLGAFQHATANAEAMEALSKELAAAGGRTSNKIPVSMAMQRIAAEDRAAAPIVLEASDHSAAADLLRGVITDSARASRTLAGSAGWRAGVRELAATVLPGTPGNGFSASVATLSPAAWQTLHATLLERVGK
jgi:high-affinity iron transporter